MTILLKGLVGLVLDNDGSGSGLNVGRDVHQITSFFYVSTG
jgi:hypothetical protein